MANYNCLAVYYIDCDIKSSVFSRADLTESKSNRKSNNCPRKSNNRKTAFVSKEEKVTAPQKVLRWKIILL